MQSPTRAMAIGLALFMVVQAPASFAEGEIPPADVTAPVLLFDAAGTPGNESYWRSDVSVTVGCEDAESGVATVLASVDGGEAAAVEGPLVVTGDGAHTVDATCLDVAGNEAALGIAFQIDATGPTGAISVGDLVLGDYSVAWVASDETSGLLDVEVQMLMPNNEWRTFCTSTFEGEDEASGTCSLPRYAGRRCHRVFAEDVAGNFGAGPETCTQTVPVTNERTEVPAPLPCALYGEDDDGDGNADVIIVRTCTVAFVSDVRFASETQEQTIIELP